MTAGDRPPEHDGWDEYDAFDDYRDADDGRDPEQGPAACAHCPGAFVADVLRESHPEATLHLLAAARELVLAMEAVVRGAEQAVQRNAAAGRAPQSSSQESPTSPTSARVRRIDIA